ADRQKTRVRSVGYAGDEVCLAAAGTDAGAHGIATAAEGRTLGLLVGLRDGRLGCRLVRSRLLLHGQLPVFVGNILNAPSACQGGERSTASGAGSRRADRLDVR